MASYDDLGKVAKSAYVLERGEYHFYVGTSVRDTVESDYVSSSSGSWATKSSSATLPSATSISFGLLSRDTVESDYVMVQEEDVYAIKGPLDLTVLMKLYGLEGYEELKTPNDLFSVLRRLL